MLTVKPLADASELDALQLFGRLILNSVISDPFPRRSFLNNWYAFSFYPIKDCLVNFHTLQQ